MNIYGAAAEAERTRAFLKDWAGEGFISGEQRQHMEKETVSGLRTTNVFLRLVLLLFTLLIVGAGAGLFFTVFLSGPSTRTASVFFFVFAIACYAAAEAAVSQARLYRYGIEEALLICSVGFLCAGIGTGIWSGLDRQTEAWIGAAGALLSLWIWHRFGLAYAFPAAMIFTIALPVSWTSSETAQHVIVTLFYALGLAAVAVARTRHRFDDADEGYSLAEACLWLGIYVAINLQLSSLDLLPRWLDSGAAGATAFPKPFYWATWGLTWCLPPFILARGFSRKDRWIIAVGLISAVLTLASNKPYLGWPRHTRDPMRLGVLLAGVAIVTRRWLARAPGGVRRGLTAERLSAAHQQWMDAGSAALGLISSDAVAPTPHPSSPPQHFGGGDSGGGGASSDF